MRVVESVPPLRKGLKTVHHGAIVTVSEGGDERKEQEDVEREDAWGGRGEKMSIIAGRVATWTGSSELLTSVLPPSAFPEKVISTERAVRESTGVGRHSWRGAMR